MIIEYNIKKHLKIELEQAKTIWIASALISDRGLSFIQQNLPENTKQNFLIGIDLSTPPSVFEYLLKNLAKNSKIFQSEYTFHPKVYIIQKLDGTLTAFIGSSNTTTWGLEKNVEMNFQINDQNECEKLLKWFNQHFDFGYLITQEFLDDYILKFKKSVIKHKEVESEVKVLKEELSKNDGQFFSPSHHTIFAKEYHRSENDYLFKIRKSVREKLFELHHQIFPFFKEYGLIDIYPHYSLQDIVAKHYFNPYSGNYIDSLWLHYGKSKEHVKSYSKSDQFINHLRLQVIIQESTLGTWLILGMPNRSKRDRKYFREKLRKTEYVNEFFKHLKYLDDDYYISYGEAAEEYIWIKDINSIDEFLRVCQLEKDDEYFIIGKDFNKTDSQISKKNIARTVLTEFRKLYPLYELMKDKNEDKIETISI